MQRYELIELNPTNVTLDTNFLPTGGLGGAGWFAVDELYANLLCFAYTGTPAGNFVLEGTPNAPVKIDSQGNVVSIAIPTNRIFVVSGSTQAAGGAAGKFAYERLSQSGFAYLRLNYQFTSSTGTLTYVCQSGPKFGNK